MNDRAGASTPAEQPEAARFDVAYRRSPEVLSRRVGADVVVATAAAAAAGEPYLLTGTALTIWNLLSTPRSVSEIAREMSTAYGADPDAISSDVQAFVADLVSRRLAEEVRDGTA